MPFSLPKRLNGCRLLPLRQPGRSTHAELRIAVENDIKREHELRSENGGKR
jgi:hypothetical protein